MTTATYTRQNVAVSPVTLPHRSVEIDNLPSAEQQAVALMTFIAGMAVDKETEAAIRAEQEEYRRQLNAYLRNKYGDEYADVDELGFESSCMGLRADHNHIF